MPAAALTDREFTQFQRFIYDAAGISMANGKQALVSGRLAKRLAHYQLNSYGDYLKLLESRAQPAELQIAVDLLTTNETYFFREPKHFNLLRELAQESRDKGRAMRVWSANPAGFDSSQTWSNDSATSPSTSFSKPTWRISVVSSVTTSPG